MDRTQKAEAVAALSSRLSKAQLLVFADYRKITVAEITTLRRKLGEAGIGYEVAKNTLARIAMSGTPLESAGKYLQGMTGMIIASEDPIAAARVLRELTKDLKKAEKFVIKGGYFDGAAIEAAEVEKVADLPGREELLATLLATLQEGPRQLVSVLQAPARDLVNLLKNYETKLEEAGQ